MYRLDRDATERFKA